MSPKPHALLSQSSSMQRWQLMCKMFQAYASYCNFHNYIFLPSVPSTRISRTAENIRGIVIAPDLELALTSHRALCTRKFWKIKGVGFQKKTSAPSCHKNGTIKRPCFSVKASLETFFIWEAQSVKIRITYSVAFGSWKQSIRVVTINVQIEASALNVENDHADALRKKVKNRFPDSATSVDFPRTK